MSDNERGVFQEHLEGQQLKCCSGAAVNTRRENLEWFFIDAKNLPCGVK